MRIERSPVMIPNAAPHDNRTFGREIVPRRPPVRRFARREARCYRHRAWRDAILALTLEKNTP